MARNGGFGVIAKAREEAAVAIALDLEFADVSLNGEAGLVVRNLLQQGSSATIRSTDVHENKASSQSSETVTNRRGGGAIIYGSPAVPLTLVGNRFFSNRYDQLAVVSSELWNLSGADCSGGANVFACPDPESRGQADLRRRQPADGELCAVVAFPTGHLAGWRRHCHPVP